MYENSIINIFFLKMHVHYVFTNVQPYFEPFFRVKYTLNPFYLKVRGAPAIGIAALLSLAVELSNLSEVESPQSLETWCHTKLDYLMTARPTGVNLKIECSALKGKFQKLQSNYFLQIHYLYFIQYFLFTLFFSEFVTKLCNHEAFKFDDARNSIISQCEDLLERDLRDNKAMGKFGAEAILKGITQKSVVPTKRF